jgi:hypothetical protein
VDLKGNARAIGTQTQATGKAMNCNYCQDSGWVCEEHPDKPMGHDTCKQQQGMPCPDCDEGDFSPNSAMDFFPDRIIGQFQGEHGAETDHFIRCPKCGGLIDMRNLSQVYEHGGPLPHPAADKEQ